MTSRASISRPEQQTERPLTKAEQQRIQERHHIERVLRQSRAKSLPKWLRVQDGRFLGLRVSWLPVGAAVVVACVLLGLCISMVTQNRNLSQRLNALHDQSSALSTKVDALSRIEQTVQQLTTTNGALQTKLQAIADGQGELTTKLTAVEAGQASTSAAWREEIAGLEKTTREGLETVASRLDGQEALAASLRQLLEQEGGTPPAAETQPAPATEAAPAP